MHKAGLRNMKGIVFTEFLEMVEKTLSPEIADLVITRSKVPSNGVYTAVGTYPHAEMVALVTTLAEITSTDTADLLRAFGRHLFGRFLKFYPQFFEGLSNSFDFLETVDNHVHVEVRKLYPDAELPSFTCVRPDAKTLVMTYTSRRSFADLAHGLIEGAHAHWREEVDVERKDSPALESGSEFDEARFTLTLRG